MNLPFFIARRYLFSKHLSSSNAINILSAVSMLGAAVGSMALIVILSVFNGFEDLVLSMYNTYSPDILVTPREGKTFVPGERLRQIAAVPGVAAVSEVLEENALLRYDEEELVVTVKGVDENYAGVTGIDSAVYEGRYLFKDEGIDLAVLGSGVAYRLSVNPENAFSPLAVFSPRREVKNLLNPQEALNRKVVYPAGVFTVQQEFDSRYIMVSLDFARDLLGYADEVSALEVAAESEESVTSVQAALVSMLGHGFVIRNRFEQDEELFKVLNSEKWVIYFILSLVVLVAAFNMIGSISMLAMEKADDIGILKAMGMSKGQVTAVFLANGFLQVVAGYLAGAAAALVLVWSQKQFGWFELKGAFVIDAYPVALRGGDFILVLATVGIIGLAASWIPAQKASSTVLFRQEA